MRSKALLGGLLAAALISTAAYTQNEPSASKAPADAKAAAPMKHSGEWRSSKLIGLNVYNTQNEKIGDINEILLTSSGNVAGVVIGVGGFLGMGEHDVLVKLDQLKFVNEPARGSDTSAARTNTGETSANRAGVSNTTGASTARSDTKADNRPARAANEKWYPDHAVMNATKDQLKGMPEFKYSSYN
jgi:hypothetical protein